MPRSHPFVFAYRRQPSLTTDPSVSDRPITLRCGMEWSRRMSFLMAGLLALATTSCGGECTGGCDAPVVETITAVSISPIAAMAVGETKQASASVSGQNVVH